MSKLILLVNLGTPSAPTTSAVKKYLAEFLSDPRVVELPKWLWLPILHGLVLNIRPKKSAHAYQKIWLEQGSPLRVYTQALAEKLQTQTDQCKVAFAMRYGKPSIKDVLSQNTFDELIVLPLYPQYANSSTGTVLAKTMQWLEAQRYIPSVKLISHYYNHPKYIEALSKQIRNFWQTNGQAEKLIISFHGIPKNSVTQGDPYLQQCQATTELLIKQLQLKEDQYQMVFQSRFGKAKWLEPYCDKTLINLAKQGTTSVDVVCPGFAVDCLETLEEIAIQNRDLFLSAGGKQFNYIPCLNLNDDHVALLMDLCHA